MKAFEFQSFYMRGRKITKQEAIEYIRDNSPVFTFAATEPDKISKEILTDGVDIWKSEEW